MPDTRINYVAVLHGRAAEMVIDKIGDYAKAKGRTIGKSRATELLLCELWNLKQLGETNKPCD